MSNRLRRLLLAAPNLLLIALVLPACSKDPGLPPSTTDPSPPAPEFSLTVEVQDEDGTPLTSGSLDVEGEIRQTDANGELEIEELDQPMVVVASTPDHFEQPVVLHREDAGSTVSIRLLRRSGPSGERRIVMHFGGDTMIGRRYQAPIRSSTPLIQTRQDAVELVAPLARLFRAADLRSLNFESVAGEFGPQDAYPAKRYLLLSPPEPALGLLETLEVDLAVLGNNHTRDYLDAGVAETIAIVEQAGAVKVGAGVTVAEAREPLLMDVSGYRMGFLSYNSVDGDPLNDLLPEDDDPVPAELPPEIAYGYEYRDFSYQGGSISIPDEPRRAGEVWEIFEDLEPTLSESEIAELWTAMIAIYPELQDWGARRGHGGANVYRDEASQADDIAELRSDGAELVVVQYHTGLELVGFKAEIHEQRAHAAIDAGADLVISHSAHVLQGFEWYRGKLIAYGLGNLLFDQNLMDTFPSAVLRIVFEEDQILRSRVYPAVIDDYQPAPVGGDAARTILLDLFERSHLEAASEILNASTKVVYEKPLEPGAEKPGFVLDQHTVRLLPAPAPAVSESVSASVDSITGLSFGLTRSRDPQGDSLGLLFGREILTWGGFEDDGADGKDAGGMHWSLTSITKRVEVVEDAPGGARVLRLRKTEESEHASAVRMVARTPAPRHRLYHFAGNDVVASDGTASYTLMMQAKLRGRGAPFARFEVYSEFRSIDPLTDPDATLLRTVELDLDIPADGEWHEVVLELPAGLFDSENGSEVAQIVPFLGLRPPPEGESLLFADELKLYEWRESDVLPDDFFRVDAVRASSGTVSATLSRRLADD